MLLGAFQCCQIKLLALAMATRTLIVFGHARLQHYYIKFPTMNARFLASYSNDSIPGMAGQVQPGPDQVCCTWAAHSRGEEPQEALWGQCSPQEACQVSFKSGNSECIAPSPTFPSGLVFCLMTGWNWITFLVWRLRTSLSAGCKPRSSIVIIARSIGAELKSIKLCWQLNFRCSSLDLPSPSTTPVSSSSRGTSVSGSRYRIPSLKTILSLVFLHQPTVEDSILKV